MIEFICTIQHNKDKIASNIVYNSFLPTGIANKIYHSDDYLCSSRKKTENENPVVHDDLEKVNLVDKYKIYDEENTDEI